MTMQCKRYENIGEDVWSSQLENGLRICVVPKKGFSGYYAALAVNYGGAFRNFTVDGKYVTTPAGVAHYLEHKMFDMPDGVSAIQKLSADGADPNAFTSAGETCYYFQCTKNFEENLKTLIEFVTTPYFTEETVKKEQGIIAQEISMDADDPGSAIYYNLLKLLYENHPIRDEVAGTHESIAQITAETLYDCHKVFYSPVNMALCVEGDVDPDRVEQIARELLPAERAPMPTADFGEKESEYPKELHISRCMSVSAPQFLFGARFEGGRGERALREHIIAQLALRMLVGYASPFYTRLYAQGLLNRDFSYDTDYSANTATVFIGGESSDPEKVLSELKAEIKKVNAGGFDPEVFARAKKASFGARLRGFENFESVCLSLADGMFEGFDSFTAPEVLADVGIEECEEFVARVLDEKKLAVSIIMPVKE